MKAQPPRYLFEHYPEALADTGLCPAEINLGIPGNNHLR
jgi:hypothetical protein